MLLENAHMKRRAARKSGRGGRALLTGLARCGRCGRMMRVFYGMRSGHAHRYQCRGDDAHVGSGLCVGIGGVRVDRAIVERVLEAVAEPAVDAALLAAGQVVRAADDVRRAVGRELEEARYEASLAERRYEHVDPAKRHVARELEARWNAALERVAALEARVARLDAELGARPRVDREALLRLARDLPRVWNAAGTDARTRQRIVRLLIEEVVVDLDDEAHEAALLIHWAGGRPSDQLPDPPLQPALSDRAAPEDAAAQQAADAELDVAQLAQQQSAPGEQGSDLLRRHRLVMHRAIPAHPQQLGDAARVLAVSLHRHGRERRLDLAGLEQHGLEPRSGQARMQPLAERPSLEPDPHDRQAEPAAEPGQHLGLAGDLGFSHDPPGRIDHAKAAGIQRDVDADKVLHGCLPLMLGADPLGPRDTIVLGGGRRKRHPEGQAHYGISEMTTPIARSWATRRGTVTWPWWYWASTKRRSSGPKWPVIPAGIGAVTVRPSGVSQRSRRRRTTCGRSTRSWTRKSS